MAKITQQPPSTPQWPWPSNASERMVTPAQVDRRPRINSRKPGDPKNPSLASAALMDFIGPAHSSEELRLPMPPPPPGHDADVETFLDRPHLLTVATRGEPDTQRTLEQTLSEVNATPERLDRMKALLSREGQMLGMVTNQAQEMREILRLMWDAQKDENY